MFDFHLLLTSILYFGEYAFTMIRNRFFVLDVMRWLLASFVIFFHFWAWTKNDFFWNDHKILASVLQFGYLSVDMFFVISGFSIFASTVKSDPVTFVALRARRLIPTFVFVSLLESITILIMYLRNLWDASFYSVVTTSLTNLLPISGKDSELRNIVAWSLGVEVLFYSIIFLFLVFTKLMNLDFKNHQLTILRILIIFCYLVKFLDLRNTSAGSLIDYLPYFIVGGLLRNSNSNKALKSRRIVDWVAIIPLVFYTLTARIQTQSSKLGFVVLAVIIVFFILMKLSVKNSGKNFQSFGKSIGSASYALYLVGGFFGITIYVRLQEKIGIPLAAFSSYSICVAIALIYQQFLDKRLQIFLGIHKLPESQK